MQEFIFDKITQALKDTLNLGEEFIMYGHTKLKDDIGLDSMSSLTFLMALEDTINGFQVDPDTLEMDHLLTVDSISEYVKNQISSVATA